MTFASNITALHPVAQMPAPRLIPDRLDDLLPQRAEADARADWVVHCTEHRFDLASRLIGWRDRLSAHIGRRIEQ